MSWHERPCHPAVTDTVSFYKYLSMGAAPLGLSSVPGCKDLGCSDISHHVQEVVAHEDSSLQQQEGEADTVPDDASLVARQLTGLLSWNIHTAQSYTI